MDREQDLGYTPRLWNGAAPLKDSPIFRDETLAVSTYRQLEVLGLSRSSLAGEIRRTAISFRAQAKEKGINTEVQKALKFVLWITKDCLTSEEFDNFLLYDAPFEVIESGRIKD